MSKYIFLIEVETRFYDLVSTVFGDDSLLEYFKGIPDLIKRVRKYLNQDDSLQNVMDCLYYDNDNTQDEEDLLYFFENYMPYIADSDILYAITSITAFGLTGETHVVL